MLLLATLFSFTAVVFLIIFVGFSFPNAAQDKQDGRLERLGLLRKRNADNLSPEDTGLKGIIKTIAEMRKKKMAEKGLPPPSRRYYLAGFDTPSAVSAFKILKWIATTTVILMFTILGIASRLELAKIVALNFLFFFLGIVFIPNIFLINKANQKMNEISRNLADTIDLLIICMEAGLGFNAALLRVAQEQKRVSPFISKEFFHTNQEILAGLSREKALRNLCDRCGNHPDLQSLVAVIIQTEKIGSSVAKTLRIQKDSIRFKRREKAKEEIMKLPVKLAFPLILFLLPALIVVILGPAAIQVIKFITIVK